MGLFNLKDVNPHRRKFIDQSIKFLPLIGVGALSYPLYQYMHFEESQSISLALHVDDIMDGITKQHNLLIYKKEGIFHIFDGHCTHMGCLLNYDPIKNIFVCPCHSSEFSLLGKRLKGPAEKDLRVVESKIENTLLLITYAVHS